MDTPEQKQAREEPPEFQEPVLFLDPVYADEENCEWPLRCCPNVQISCDACPYQREHY